MKFMIPIVPKAQMRTGAGTVTLADGKVRGTVFKKKKQREAEGVLVALLEKYQPSVPMQGALLLGVRAYLPMPAGKPKWYSGKPKEFHQDARSGAVRPITKPDLDNLLKCVKDCLTTLQFWGDDKQVVGYLPDTGKYYSDRPRWEIEIVPFRAVGVLG